jgi:hypothetical protein
MFLVITLLVGNCTEYPVEYLMAPPDISDIGDGEEDIPYVIITENIMYSWNKPTTGSPVDIYIGQLEISGVVRIPFTCSEDTFWIFEVRVDKQHRLRIAGIDSAKAQGPWSMWSKIYPKEEVPQQIHRN